MIKRYTLKEDEIHVNPRKVIKLPYLSEHEHGEYVRYADHTELLESIGAGGVSGRVMRSTTIKTLILGK